MNSAHSPLLGLPAAEKLELVEALWDSLGDSLSEIPLPEWQKEELAKRKAAHDRDPSAVVTWEEAKARILDGRG